MKLSELLTIIMERPNGTYASTLQHKYGDVWHQAMQDLIDLEVVAESWWMIPGQQWAIPGTEKKTRVFRITRICRAYKDYRRLAYLEEVA